MKSTGGCVSSETSFGFAQDTLHQKLMVDPSSSRLHWSIVIASIAGEARVTTNEPAYAKVTAPAGTNRHEFSDPNPNRGWRGFLATWITPPLPVPVAYFSANARPLKNRS